MSRAAIAALALPLVLAGCHVQGKNPAHSDENVMINADGSGRVAFNFPFAKGEPNTRVTFVLKGTKDKQTELTVIHDRFGAGGQTREWVSGGWPFLISNLKTYLETGTPLQDGGYGK